MRREERFMNILGGLDHKYVEMAMPRYAGRNEADDTRHIVIDTSAEAVEISKKDVRRYMIMRLLGMAAVVALIVGAAVLLVRNWDKIAVREPERPGVITTVIEPDVTSGSAITELITTEPANIKYDPAFDLLGKAYFDTDGAFRISDSEWTEMQDYNTFKEYFYGIWDRGDREVVFDDSEKSEFAMLANYCFLTGFYRSGESTLIFCMGGSAESSIWWLDMDQPDTLYWAGGSAGKEPNGIYLYDGIPNIAEFSRTDKEINEPENGYLSVIRQRELAAEHGFPLGLITDIETEYNNITINHDAKYYAYPVYLISESDDKIVLRTTLGKMYDAIGNVTYSIEKNENGEWIQKIDSITSADDNPAHVRQTFDVKYYYKNDLAGIAAGYFSAFQSPYDMYADGTGWEWIGNAECKDLFASDHDKFPNEVPAELIAILKNYADGDDLKPDLGGDFEPITKRYMILSDNEAYPSGDGIISYRIGYTEDSDFLITVDTDTGGLSVFRENTKYTAARRVMELLWANYDDSFEVFAVLDSDNGERVEYLLICASDNLFVIGEEERYNALERVKSLLSENGLLDDDLIKFTTPGQLRETWIPVEIIDDTGRLNESMIRVADRVFRLADDMDIEEYEKFLKDNGMIAPDAPRKAMFGLGEAVTPYKDLLDILDIGVGDSPDLRNYGQITDEIIQSTGIVADTVEVWVYDKALSEAVWKTVHVRMLQELCPQIKKIDLVVGSEPDEYKIVIHANTSDQELLKNNEAFKMFYDPEFTEFAE